MNLVVNMEVPWEHNTYLHRIGRGGRFGSLSLSVTLAALGEEVTKLLIGNKDDVKDSKVVDPEQAREFAADQIGRASCRERV